MKILDKSHRDYIAMCSYMGSHEHLLAALVEMAEEIQRLRQEVEDMQEQVRAGKQEAKL